MRLAALTLSAALGGCASAPPASTPASAPSAAASDAAESAAASDAAAAEGAAPPAVGAPAKINERWVKATPVDAAKTLERETREVYAARAAVLDALGLDAGEAIADIGAGSGFFVKMFAEVVGPEGRVYAVDIAPALVEGIRTWASTSGATHVQAILGAPDDPRLPAESVDAVFISDTYHHFEAPAPVMAGVQAALRPGGRLFVLDFERVPGVSADWILEHVRAGKQAVLTELEAAGFELVEEHEVEGLEENYLLELRAR